MASQSVVLFSLSETGHLNPLCAFAEALVLRGWTVHMFAPKLCQQQIEATGALWCHYGKDDWDLFTCAQNVVKQELRMELPQELVEPLVMPVAVTHATLGVMPYLIERLAHLKPRFIAYDAACPWGYVAGEVSHIPSVALMTALPMPMGAREQMSRTWSSTAALDASTEAIEARYGIALNHNYSYTNYSPYTIVFGSRVWHGAASEEFSPEQFHYWGPLISNMLAAGDAEDASNATKIVFVSLGTVATGSRFLQFKHIVHDFYSKVCAVARRMPNVEFVLSIGKRANISWSADGSPVILMDDIVVPTNVTIERKVNQVAMLQRANAFVTHCGQGSSNEAVLAGVPVVACPFFGDQLDNASRFVEFGCGLSQSYYPRDRQVGLGLSSAAMDCSCISEESLYASIWRLLHEPSFKQAVREVRERQAQEGGGVDKRIEHMVTYVESVQNSMRKSRTGGA